MSKICFSGHILGTFKSLLIKKLLSWFKAEKLGLLALGDCLRSSVTFIGTVPSVISLVFAVCAQVLLAIGDSVALQIISRFYK